MTMTLTLRCHQMNTDDKRFNLQMKRKNKYNYYHNMLVHNFLCFEGFWFDGRYSLGSSCLFCQRH